MKSLFLTFLLLLSSFVFGQTELCYDGIDNDQDGLIDCQDLDCASSSYCSFTCTDTSKLYQIRNDTLNYFDSKDNKWVPVSGWNNYGITDINAIGFNTNDNFIYGIQSTTNNLIRISPTRAFNEGAVTNLPNGPYYVGEMIESTLYASSHNHDKMQLIDVQTGTAQPQEFSFNGYRENLRIADWAYLAKTDKFYGVLGANTLRAMNPNGTHHADITLSGMNCIVDGNQGPVGAMFVDGNGNLFASCNNGTLYRLEPNENATNFEVSVLTTPPPGFSPHKNNDGASCPYASFNFDDEKEIDIPDDTLSIDNTLVEVELPNIFSPNGDGVNDYFSFIKNQGVSNTIMHIYNRWGEQVYKGNMQPGWDGTTNGKQLPAGTYFWVVTFDTAENQNNVRSGIVELVR